MDSIRRSGAVVTRCASVSLLLACVGSAQSWIPDALGRGASDQVYSISAASPTDIVIAGWLTQVDGLPVNHVARWDGSSWSAMGSGLPFPARNLCRLPDGSLLATVGFQVHRFQGSNWSLHSTLPIGPQSLLRMPNGTLVACGVHSFQPTSTASCVVAWQGTTWAPLGQPIHGFVLDLELRANGELVAVGNFQVGSTSCQLAAWDGVAWTPIVEPGNPGGFCERVTVMQDGDLVTTHRLSSPQRWEIHRLGSAGWSQVARDLDQEVAEMVALPDGDLAISGEFTSVSGFTALRFARLRGSRVHFAGAFDGGVLSMSYLPTGRLVVGGAFQTVARVPQPGIGVFGPTVAGSASIYGAGCPQANGDRLTIAPVGPAVVGGPCSSIVSGLGNGLAIQFFGTQRFSAGLQLQGVLAGALPGCLLFASPDWLDATFVLSPIAYPVGIVVPNDPLLEGFVVQQQAASLDLSGSIATSNAVEFRIGRF